MAENKEHSYYLKNREAILCKANDYYAKNKEKICKAAKGNITTYLKNKKI